MVFREHADDGAVGAVGKSERNRKQDKSTADAGTAKQAAGFLTKEITESNFPDKHLQFRFRNWLKENRFSDNSGSNLRER